MSVPRIVSFRIAPEKVAELDTLAKTMNRDRSFLINEAVESYLSEQRRFVAMVEDGQNDFRGGRTLTQEQVERIVGEREREGR